MMMDLNRNKSVRERAGFTWFRLQSNNGIMWPPSLMGHHGYGGGTAMSLVSDARQNI